MPHCHSPGVATVARRHCRTQLLDKEFQTVGPLTRLRIDVHNNDDDDDTNDNA